MAVTSKPSKSTREPTDWSLLIARVALGLTVLTFGGIVWAINGGFSVIGLGVIAGSFNDAGKVFWEAVTLWTFTVPVDAPALPTRQPVVPWIVVITTTVVQVVVLYRKLSGKPVPPWLWVTAAVLSLYDFGTTYAGLGTVVWLRQVGIIARGVLAFLLTFVVETAAGFALKRR